MSKVALYSIRFSALLLLAGNWCGHTQHHTHVCRQVAGEQGDCERADIHWKNGYFQSLLPKASLQQGGVMCAAAWGGAANLLFHCGHGRDNLRGTLLWSEGHYSSLLLLQYIHEDRCINHIFTSHISPMVYTITLGALIFYLIQFTWAWLLNTVSVTQRQKRYWGTAGKWPPEFKILILTGESGNVFSHWAKQTAITLHAPWQQGWCRSRATFPLSNDTAPGAQREEGKMPWCWSRYLAINKTKSLLERTSVTQRQTIIKRCVKCL